MTATDGAERRLKHYYVNESVGIAAGSSSPRSTWPGWPR